MPEWPEVAVAIRTIAPKIVGRPILSAKVSDHLDGEWWDAEYLESGFIVAKVKQRGKYIEIHLLAKEEAEKMLMMGKEDRATYRPPAAQRGLLLVHLGMSGMVTTMQVNEEIPQPHHHMHIRLGPVVWTPPFIDPSHIDELGWHQTLRLVDPRKFGRVMVCQDPTRMKRAYKSTGPDLIMVSNVKRETGIGAMDLDQGEALFVQRLREVCQPDWTLKKCMMDQRAISGFGNIYDCEALFLAGLHPCRTLGKSADRWLRVLYQESFKLLRRAVQDGGSSIGPYRGPNGRRGLFQLQHNVYGREGKPCKVCETEIRARKVDGRSTFWCPNCQK